MVTRLPKSIFGTKSMRKRTLTIQTLSSSKLPRVAVNWRQQPFNCSATKWVRLDANFPIRFKKIKHFEFCINMHFWSPLICWARIWKFEALNLKLLFQRSCSEVLVWSYLSWSRVVLKNPSYLSGTNFILYSSVCIQCVVRSPIVFCFSYKIGKIRSKIVKFFLFDICSFRRLRPIFTVLESYPRFKNYVTRISSVTTHS